MLNERGTIEVCLENLDRTLREVQANSKFQWDVCVSDGGSQDGSAEHARALCSQFGFGFCQAELSQPSVGRTINSGLPNVNGDFVFVYPCDTYLSAGGFFKLEEAIYLRQTACGGFLKRYDPTHLVLRFFEKIQNHFRLPVLRNLGWTHGIFFRKELLREGKVPDGGFLEDILLSDRLRNHPKWGIVPAYLQVSSRLYFKNKIIRRIFLNLFIYFLFRTGFFGPLTLRRAYYWLK